MLHFDWADRGGYAACTLMLLYVALNSFGMFLLPGVMMGELLPSSVRGVASSATFSIFNIALFMFAKVGRLLRDDVGQQRNPWHGSRALPQARPGPPRAQAGPTLLSSRGRGLGLSLGSPAYRLHHTW